MKAKVENKIKQPFFYLLYFCVILSVITGCSTRTTPAPVIAIKGAKPVSEQKITQKEYYIVQKGETLYSIAWRADSDMRTLAQINNITSPYIIVPGQKIFLTPPKNANTSIDKSYKNNQNKSSKKNQDNSKKPIAPNKKQEYGETVSEEKRSLQITSPTTTFSTKIKEWKWPAHGKVIEVFSTAEKGNKGIDIAGRRGDKVKAAADGKVVYVGSALRGYGNLIIIKHNDDYLSAYAHNDKILVKEQQLVSAGNIIAYMGSTDAERVMLHFEVRFRGKSVNPMKYLPQK